MNYTDEAIEKLKREKSGEQYNVVTEARGILHDYENAVGRSCGSGPLGYEKATTHPSLREEAEKQVGYHRIEADKADRAARFLRENPAFDEFIQLIRQGAISI